MNAKSAKKKAILDRVPSIEDADWVRNVFIPRMENALSQSERALERIASSAG